MTPSGLSLGNVRLNPSFMAVCVFDVRSIEAKLAGTPRGEINIGEDHAVPPEAVRPKPKKSSSSKSSNLIQKRPDQSDQSDQSTLKL